MKRYFLSLTILIIPFLLSACSATASDSSVYKKGQLNQVQKAVSFNIILPKYLPEDLRSLTPNFNVFVDNETSTISNDIMIGYFPKGNYQGILIHEQKSQSILHPNDSLEYEVFYIKGIKIVEETQKSQPPDLYYSWNINGILYTLQSDICSKEDCRKIVESMID
jgi:hypothetical protein